MAGRYAAVISASALSAAIFRAVVNRIFSTPSDRLLLRSLLFAAILGILWFTFAFICVFRTMRNENRLVRQNDSRDRAKGWKSLVRGFGLSFGIAVVLSLSVWLALELNDEIMQSRMLPWISPLITVQHYGFGAASRLFPCHAEGSDTGCEAHKTVPAFLAANALAYFPFVLCVVIYCRFVARFCEVLQTGAPVRALVCPTDRAGTLCASGSEQTGPRHLQYPVPDRRFAPTFRFVGGRE
jgi:hypothetical protein